MMQFIRDHFDKLLLGVLVLCYFLPAIKGVAFAQRTSDVVLGALITLVTGKAIAKAAE